MRVCIYIYIYISMTYTDHTEIVIKLQYTRLNHEIGLDLTYIA